MIAAQSRDGCACSRYYGSTLVDSHNIDGVLGQILGHRPKPEQRPRWDRVKTVLCQHLGFDSKPCFVFDQRRFTKQVYPLYRFLHSAGYDVRTAILQGNYADNDDPVDEFILDQLHLGLDELRGGGAVSVAVVSHDHIYAPVLAEILRAGGRVAIVGFLEWFAPYLLSLEDIGAEIVDLEHDIGGFSARLPRPSSAVLCPKL